MPFVAFYHTHKLVVVLFLLIYLIKAILLLGDKKDALKRFSKIIKVPEMIISTILLLTGGIMLMRIAEFKTLFIIKLSLVVVAIPIAIIAYRKYNKLFGAISIIMLISAYGFAEMYRASFAKKQQVTTVVTDPGAADYNITVHGAALFSAQCIVCHGSDGKANLSGAKDLTLSTLSENEIIAVLKTGKNAMPKMSGIYNEQELKALANYVTALR